MLLCSDWVELMSTGPTSVNAFPKVIGHALRHLSFFPGRAECFQDRPVYSGGMPSSSTHTYATMDFGETAYFRSLLLIIFIALVRALHQPIPDKKSPIGRLLSKLIKPAPVRTNTGKDLWKEVGTAMNVDVESEPVQVLQIGVEIELASKILADIGQARTGSFPSGTVLAAPPRNHAAGEHTVSGVPVRAGNPPSPHRFGQPRECPDAHEALDLEHDGEDQEGHGDLIALVEAIFLVFAPRYRHEIYHLMIPSNSTVNEAIHQIADTRDSETSICFACLTPAVPQPTSAFACLLATPVWVSSGICLLDARSINQGIFAHQFFGRIKRASILLQIGHPPPSDLQVFHDGTALEDEVLHEFPTGCLLVILPAEAGYVARPTFQQVLTNSGWDQSDPFLHPETRTDFLMIHEHGQRVLPIDLDNDDTSAKFKR
ncbi:hypothetical protein AK812_SmicGene3513 [Symbiodinium microadriaticum]|uniref:Uncharacterized protein n=1 Tax=Symbiodinium microadriaticum TaxID=2951 RepID=A0A1Q9EYP1_SYMMI|nr:hypothetical protein AK812_SmicGene3513 [Symbiodinium microadriaticum]CAE7440416.1 unnamed protein product [Symbiodinium sp. KB8]CAE7866945.1 unnamed protein product [Symbiodinium microadriaticum]